MAFLQDILKQYWDSLPASPADPREETPAQARHRLHHLERSAQAVHNKIERVYELSPTTEPTPERVQAMADTVAANLIGYARPQEILHRNWIPQAELQTAMAEGIRDYFTMFLLYRDMQQCPPTHEGYERYGSERGREALFKIYANHLTNAAEARFIAHRVDALDAHMLNGLMIRTTIDMAKELIHDDAHLSPAQLRPETDLQAIEQVDQLRSYWRRRVTDLNAVLAEEPRR